MERVILAMVANRALAPSSKLGLEEWISKKVLLPGLNDLQHEVFNAVADLFNLEVDLLFFDTTSMYFEMDEWNDEDFQRTADRTFLKS